MIMLPSYMKRFYTFHRFIQKYLDVTPLVYRDNESLIQNIPKGDIYLTGSDQVWNSEWNGEIDKALFLDFVPKGLLRKSSMRCDSITRRNYIINKFKILENLELIKFDDKILEFLDMHTLIELKNISKVFHKIVIPYIVTFLKKEKKNIMNIKESLGITNIPQREDLENIVLNKGSKKAMQLLNETLLNQLFKDKKFPSDDIIFIYRIKYITAHS